MEIIIRLSTILAVFLAVVLSATAYIWFVIFLLKKGIIGDTGANAMYFGAFVIASAIVYHLKLY
ncbi:hypothetical protein I5M99_18630 [Serratia marcescens]|uniref:hypothetical protein n=1 Tax=Serratia marcescens TaxID=615 RepID=UPI000B60D42D|nr:hypothetical protein [Serratia marcescens]ASM17964.1 hypothetical protein BVG90_15030 [Serratia marcescens]MBH3138823.1 hypothetical protein [Serratia marcescens]